MLKQLKKVRKPSFQEIVDFCKQRITGWVTEKFYVVGQCDFFNATTCYAHSVHRKKNKQIFTLPKKQSLNTHCCCGRAAPKHRNPSSSTANPQNTRLSHTKHLFFRRPKPSKSSHCTLLHQNKCSTTARAKNRRVLKRRKERTNETAKWFKTKHEQHVERTSVTKQTPAENRLRYTGSSLAGRL